MVSRSRMPPPSCIGILPPTALTISLITASFLGLPATAPFRSTRCNRRAPCSSQCRATAAGSSENTVSLSMSPCSRRTARPSLISIAGMISMCRCSGEERKGLDARRLGLPGYEIREQREAGGLAFLGVKLHGENIILRHCAGKGETVDAVARNEFGFSRLDVKTVHEIIAVAVGDAAPQRVRLGL